MFHVLSKKLSKSLATKEAKNRSIVVTGDYARSDVVEWKEQQQIPSLIAPGKLRLRELSFRRRAFGRGRDRHLRRARESTNLQPGS